MTPEMKMVREFHEAFTCHVADKPGFPAGLFASEDAIPLLTYYAQELAALASDLKYVAAKQNAVGNSALGLILIRLQLQVEETGEFAQAVAEGDLVGALAELTDIGYVTRGTHLTLGTADIEAEALEVVHNCNMSKLGEDGKPIIHESGRVVKGPNFYGPREGVQQLIERARGNEIHA